MRRRANRYGRVLLCLWLMAGCDSVSSPEGDLPWRLSSASKDIGLLDILPIGVEARSVGGELFFQVVDSARGSQSSSLGEICGMPCANLNGSTAPVPGFTFLDSLDALLQPDLVSVAVQAGELELRVTNGLGFDVMRPHSDPDSAGSVVLVTRDLGSGALLDSTVISGALFSLPSGSAFETSIGLGGGAVIAGGTRTVATFDSPFDGQAATVDTALQLEVRAVLANLIATSVTMVADNELVREDYPAELDEEIRDQIFAELRRGVGGRIQEASMEFEIQHNLDIDAAFDISLSDSRPELFPGSNSDANFSDVDFSTAAQGRVVTRELSAADAEALLSFERIYVGVQGSVTGGTLDARGRRVVTLRPADGMSFRFRLNVRIEPGRGLLPLRFASSLGR